MVGRVVVVTGTNGCIGFETSMGLAALGAAVVMVCRDSDRGAAARDAIADAAGGPAPLG